MVNHAFSFLRPFVNDNRMGNPDNSRYSCLDFTGNSFISHNWVITPNNIKCGKGNNTVPHPHLFTHGPKAIFSAIVFIAFGIHCNRFRNGEHPISTATASRNSNGTMDSGERSSPTQRSALEILPSRSADGPLIAAADSVGNVGDSPQQLHEAPYASHDWFFSISSKYWYLEKMAKKINRAFSNFHRKSPRYDWY